MMPTVLVLIGLAGSGKTTAAAYFKKKKFPIVRMGEVTDKLLKESGLPYSEKNEKYVRENLRKRYGQDVYAKKVIPSVLRLIKKNNLIHSTAPGSAPLRIRLRLTRSPILSLSKDKLCSLEQRKRRRSVSILSVPRLLNQRVEGLIIIDGMRNKEELDLFRKNLPNLKIIFLNADKEIRYKRLHKRRQRPLTLTEAKERDISELKYFKLHNLRKYADYIVDNNLKLADLYKQLREILTKLTQ